MSNRNRLQNTPEPRLARRDTLKLGGTLLGVAGLGPLLAACAEAASPTAAALATGATTTALWWVAWSRALEEVNGMWDAYRTVGNRPDADLETTLFPSDRLPERLLLAQLGGGGPNFYRQSDLEWAKFAYNRGAEALPLDVFGIDSYDEIGQWYKSPKYADYMKAASPDGKIYSVIWNVTVEANMYNATLFDEMGIPRPSVTEPMTWDEWAEITPELALWEGDRLVRSGYGARVSAPHWKEAFNYYFAMPIKQAGGSLLSEDGKSVVWNTPDSVDALQTVVTMIQESTVPGFIADSFADFENGRIAVWNTFPAAYTTILAREPDFEIGVAPLPVVAGGEQIYSTIATSFMVNPYSEGNEEAWKFIAWAIQNPSDAWAYDAQNIGTALALPSTWLDAAMEADPNTIPFYGTQDVAEPALLHPLGLEIKDVAMAALNKMVVENVPVAEALAAAQVAGNAILEKG